MASTLEDGDDYSVAMTITDYKKKDQMFSLITYKGEDPIFCEYLPLSIGDFEDSDDG